MIESNEPVVFKGRTYPACEGIGFDGEYFVVQMYTYSPQHDGDRANHFTSLPISPKRYRERHPTKAAYVVSSETSVTVLDDWGNDYHVSGSSEFIARLISDMQSGGLSAVRLRVSLDPYSCQSISEQVE